MDASGILEGVMAGKAKNRVLASPIVAGAAITAADPSGLWGLMKEGMAGGWALLQAKQDASANALAKAVAEDFADGDARTLARDRLQAIFKDARPADLKAERSRSFARLPRSSMPRPLRMRWRSSDGWVRSHRRLLRRRTKEAFWASVGSP